MADVIRAIMTEYGVSYTEAFHIFMRQYNYCLLYTSPSPRD